jgi:hypothetical protein
LFTKVRNFKQDEGNACGRSVFVEERIVTAFGETAEVEAFIFG